MTIQEAQERVIRAFSLFTDWTEKYEYIIKMGRKLPEFPEKYRKEENKVRGCQSQVWLFAELQDRKVHFSADSDALIVKGLAALLLSVYNDQEPDDILASPPDFIKKIGMDTHLSPTRSNGLFSMIKQIKMYAMAFKTKLESAKSS